MEASCSVAVGVSPRGNQHPSFYIAHVSRARSQWTHARRHEWRLRVRLGEPYRSGNIREAARVLIGDGWRGLIFSPSGDKLYAGNGSRGSFTEFSLSGSNLSPERQINLYPGEKAGTVPHLIADLVAENGACWWRIPSRIKFW